MENWVKFIEELCQQNVLFICLESVLAGLILFGTGYIAVLS